MGEKNLLNQARPCILNDLTLKSRESIKLGLRLCLASTGDKKLWIPSKLIKSHMSKRNLSDASAAERPLGNQRPLEQTADPPSWGQLKNSCDKEEANDSET